MWYKLKIKKGQVLVRNLQVEDDIRVTISRIESCSSVIVQKFKSYAVDFEETVTLPLVDGDYKILIERTKFGVLLDSAEYIFPYYPNLLKSIISEIQYFLCNCSCKECDDCNKNEVSALSTLLKTFSYYTILHKYYSRFYDTVFKCLKCDILDLNNCILLNEKILGNAQNESLLKKVLSSFYLSFYFAEFFNAEDEESEIEINNIFKYSEISKCIKTTNVDIDCITNQIKNNMGIFQITFGAYENQPPSHVGNYTSTAGNRAVLVLTSAMFTTLTTPVYSDPENDPAQAIRIDSLPTNSAVLKLGSNNVTVGQIITMNTINGGSLKLEGPDLNALTTCSFNFSVRDTGSMQFVSS